MMIRNRQIPIRRILCIVIGWLHCTLLIAPIYALILNFTNDILPRETVIRNHLRGLLIIVPIIISWLARRYLRNILLYLLASVAAVLLTIWLFDNPVMAVPAVFICFLRFYNRIIGEDRSLLDHPGYAGLAVFLIAPVITFFVERLDSIYQPLGLLYMAIYFLLCFTHHGIERIESYIDVNKDMRNMPARRILRISSALLAAAVVIFSITLLPALLNSDMEYRYTPPPVSEEETSLSLPEEEILQDDTGQGDMMAAMDVEPNPILEAIFQILEYVLVIGFSILIVFGIIYGALHLSRMFRQSFQDRGDFVENLQDDELEAIRERARRIRDRPGLFDRSPNAVIRRRYRKTVLHAAKNRPQAWMTPCEAENHAGLTGDAIERLHNVYEKARYSPEGCTRQDFSQL